MRAILLLAVIAASAHAEEGAPSNMPPLPPVPPGPSLGETIPNPSRSSRSELKQERSSERAEESVIYYYKDEQGSLHAVDSLDSVPKQFRDKVKKMPRRK